MFDVQCIRMLLVAGLRKHGSAEKNIMAWLSDRNICAHDSILLKVRMPGVEPGSQAWEACMIPLHYMRSYHRIVVHGKQAVAQQHTS